MTQSANPDEKPAQPAPVGTWALMLCVGIAMAIAWLFVYFGVFLPRGGVH